MENIFSKHTSNDVSLFFVGWNVFGKVWRYKFKESFAPVLVVHMLHSSLYFPFYRQSIFRMFDLSAFVEGNLVSFQPFNHVVASSTEIEVLVILIYLMFETYDSLNWIVAFQSHKFEEVVIFLIILGPMVSDLVVELSIIIFLTFIFDETFRLFLVKQNPIVIIESINIIVSFIPSYLWIESHESCITYQAFFFR